MGSIYLRKYGTATTVDFCLYELDGTDLRTNAVDGGADCSIMKDEGPEATCTNDFVDEGNGYSLALTATEMQASRIVVYVIDQTATKVWLDKVLIIETYGNASAQHPFDLGTATVNLSAATETDIDDIHTQVDHIHDTDLPAVKTDTGAIHTVVDDIHDTDLPDLHTDVGTVAGYIDTEIAAIKAITDTLTLSAIADAVWDEVITAGVHATADSAAQYLRNLYLTVISQISQAQGGAAGSIILVAGASAVNDYYKGQTIVLTGGTGAGQARACYAYDGGTKVASIRPDWATAPDITTWYGILSVGSSVTAAIEAAAVDSIIDETTETGITLRKAINIMLAALAGKSSGGGTATITFRDQADTKNRISATVTADGNRTAITNDGA